MTEENWGQVLISEHLLKAQRDMNALLARHLYHSEPFFQYLASRGYTLTWRQRTWRRMLRKVASLREWLVRLLGHRCECGCD